MVPSILCLRGTALLVAVFWLAPAPALAQNAVSTGTRAGFRMYSPTGNDWWMDPSSGRFDIRMNGGLPFVSLNGLGYLGIGATNPTSLLHARDDQNGEANLTVQNPNPGAASLASLRVVSDQSEVSVFAFGSNYAGTFSGTGINRAGLRVIFDNSNPSFPSNGLLIGSTNSKPLYFMTGGSEAGRFDASGRLGLGTTSPSEKLEVSGNIKLSGATTAYRLINVADPVSNTDAATKSYVDARIGGGGKTPYMQTFTNAQCPSNSPCSWSPPSGVSMVWVSMCGGGGGGGASTQAGYGGGGGGGGSGYFYQAFPVSVSGSQSIIVGGGGGGGPTSGNGGQGGNGSSGGPSSFGSLLSANGGQGGYAPPSYYAHGGDGGAGGGGGGGGGNTYTAPGAGGGWGAGAGSSTGTGGMGGGPNGGAAGLGTNGAGGGGGGGSPFGAGGAGGNGDIVGGNTAGSPGGGYCAGGGGGGYPRAGGSGAPGVVILEWTQ